MPAQASGPQIEQRDPQFTEEETRALAAYVATAFGPGPAIPDGEYLTRPTATSPRAPSCSASTAPCATTSPAPAAR